MRRFRTIGLYLCIVAVWMQLVVPATALSMDNGADGFASICRTTAADPAGHPGPAPMAHQHHCCLVGHADLAAAPLAPVSQPLVFSRHSGAIVRWARSGDGPRHYLNQRQNRPRGPPALD